jgi:3-phenylpropionate/cinnamic acid dioxygenase small subunit
VTVAEPGIRRVEAELEIRNVIAQLARLADTGDTDAYLRLLTDDVVWAMPPNPAMGLPASERRGHDEIGAGQRDRIASGVQGPGSDTMHVVTTVVVDVHDDERAQAWSHFLFLTTTSTSPTLTNVGRYEDEFQRTPEGWKLARRTIRFG